MATRQRAYFFDSPFTSAGVKFNPNNIPTKNTFYDLLDSVCFKTESGDLATTTQQGLVLLATDAVSKLRSGAGVVSPNQLPVLCYGASNTELITPGTGAYEGILLTAIAGTNRLDYKIDFNPTSLTAKVTPTVADYVVISDTADSGKPKKSLLSTLMGSSLFTRTSTTLTPTNAGDDLDMSGGDVTADSFLLKAAASTYINPLSYTGNNGANLFVSGGAGQHASAAKTGGNLYLRGGSGANGGAVGVTYLGWDGTTQNNVAVRGAVNPPYPTTITGSVCIKSGVLWVEPNPIGIGGGGSVTTDRVAIYGDDNILYTHSLKSLAKKPFLFQPENNQTCKILVTNPGSSFRHLT